eukprot:scaffold18993_cov66-Phaeocystis_antarctica.AAC.3
MPSSAESAERLLLFQTLAALVIFTAGSSIMVTTRSSATSLRERAVRRSKRRLDAPKLSDTACSGRPSMPATRRRTAVLLNAFTSATSTWSGSSSTVWLIACSTTLVTVVAAWAEAPGRAGRGCDAPCLGIEAWWGILAVAEAAQSTAAPKCASRARHCGRRLSGAHGASGALEAHGLAALAHEAAGRARHTRAQTLRDRNSAWAAWRLLRAARGRKVARLGLRALTGAGEAGGAGMRALLARQRSASTLGAVRAGLAEDARLLALALLVGAGRAPDARGHARVWRDRAGAALTRLRRARTARRSRRALQAVVGARHREVELQRRLVLVGACLARQCGPGALRAVRAGRARPAHQLARRGLEGAGLALETRAHVCVGRDRAGVAGRLHGATGWRVVALGSRRACRISCEVGGVGVRALLARQRRAGTLGAVRSRLAGDARLLALVGLVLAGGAFVAEGSARGGRNEAGRAVSAVGWVGAPRDRIGLPWSARLARRAAILATVWVERAGGARCERLPQARRSLCRTIATAWTVAALGRLDVLAQLAHRAGGAACASLVRVVGTGCARNAAIFCQAGDTDADVRTGRTREWLNTCIRAELAPAIALATTSGVGLDRFVAIVASRALVWTAGEVHWGHDQWRWRDP